MDFLAPGFSLAQSPLPSLACMGWGAREGRGGRRDCGWELAGLVFSSGVSQMSPRLAQEALCEQRMWGAGGRPVPSGQGWECALRGAAVLGTQRVRARWKGGERTRDA